MYLEYKFNNQSDLPIYISHDLYDFESDNVPEWTRVLRRNHRDDRTVNINTAFSRHKHANIEILYLLRGRVTAIVGDAEYTLTGGDMLVINPFTEHTASVDPSAVSELICVIPNYECFSGSGSAASELISKLFRHELIIRPYIAADTQHSERLGSLMKSIASAKEAGGNRASGIFHINSCLLELFSLLTDDAMLQNGSASERHKVDIGFYIGVNSYIAEHYCEELTTAKTAAVFGYSESYFCVLFKEHFGVPFISHLQSYRVECAKQLYRELKLPLAEISRRVGFNDYCYFSRVFSKLTGLSPREFFETQ